MTDRATLAERFRKAAADWKGSWLTTVDVHVEVRDLPVIADALSASAGPQAEAVTIEQLALRHLQTWGSDIRLVSMLTEFAKELLRAHPQPQQADERGAVRGALREIVKLAPKREPSGMECHCTVCEMRNIAEAALQQSPAADGAAVTRPHRQAPADMRQIFSDGDNTHRFPDRGGK